VSREVHKVYAVDHRFGGVEASIEQGAGALCKQAAQILVAAEVVHEAVISILLQRMELVLIVGLLVDIL
jgi:hypothetical protein